MDKSFKNVENFRALGYAIITQAVEDYKFLLNERILSYGGNRSRFTQNELRKFFKGAWCNELLYMIGCDMSGEEIMATVKRECRTA